MIAGLGIGAVFFPGAGLASHQEENILGYGQNGWLYRIEPAQGPLPLDILPYQGVGRAPFGGQGGCGLPAPRTQWPVNTMLHAAHAVVVVPGTSAVKVHVAIDNDIQVSWNGMDISGFVVREECTFFDQFTFPVPDIVVQPVNLVEVHAVDRGGMSFFDLRVSGLVPHP